MKSEYFGLDDLNKLWTKFKRDTGQEPTLLILGQKEKRDWDHISYSPHWTKAYCLSSTKEERMKKFEEDLWKLHNQPFGLDLIVLKQESYIELQ